MAQTHTIAATINATSGDVTVVRDGQTLTLRVNDKVFSSDTIKTNDASVELHFVDGAKAILSPNTVMSVQEFSTTIEKPSFILDLATGAMRSISGKVVEQNPDSFKVFTPKATVGIRGTDFITKVNEDGSEVHAVISLSQGHNLVITTHDGEQISLTTSHAGAFIGTGSSTTLSPYTFTDEELEDIISSILGTLDYEEESKNDDDTEVTPDNSIEGLTLEQALTESLNEESQVELLEALTEAGSSSDDESDSDDLNLGEQEDILLGDGDNDSPFDDGYINMSTLGNVPYYADIETDVSSGTHQYSNHRVNISANMNTAQDSQGNDVVISGDINSMSDGTVTGGSDEITGLDASAGRIVGDANTVTGGTLVSGDDSITVNSKTGGASLYGDVYSVTGASTVDFGHDVIHVKDVLSNTTVSGDANIIDMATVTVNVFGDDSIHVGGAMTNASIYGDYNDPASTEGGDDTIRVDGEMAASSTIYGNGGDDAIYIGSYGGGIIDGGEGADSLSITTLTSNYSTNQISNVESITIEGVGSNGIYAGTANTDDFTFQHISGTGRIEGQGGNDSITISHNMSGGTVDGGAGADTLNVSGAMSGGTVSGDADNDLINISTAMTGGTIDGGAGTDTVSFTNSNITGTVSNTEELHLEAGMAAGTLTLSTVTTLSKDGTENFSMSGGTIIGSVTADSFTLASHTGGTINGGNGDDTYTIASLSQGIFDGGSGADIINLSAQNQTGTVQNSGIEQDTLYLQNGMNGGTLTLESAAGGFTVEQSAGTAFAMTGGTLNTSDGADSIAIFNMSNATINAGAGNDSISFFATMENSTIHSGSGADTINLASTSTSNTIINSGVEQDTLFLQFDLNGSTLNLESSGGGFTISQDAATAFDMARGTLNASNGADSFSINAMTNGTINGANGNDSFTIATMDDGTINSGDDDDTFIITSMSGGVINGGNGTDRATLSQNTQTGSIQNIEHIYLSAGIAAGALTLAGAGSSLAQDDVNGFDLSGTASIIGTTGNDTVTMNTMSGGSLSGGDGNDAFTATSYAGGTLNGGNGSDTFTITGSVGLGNTVDFGQVSQVESLIITSVEGGTVTGSGDDEHITITTMNNGTVNGNGGEDTVTITNLQGNTNHFENLKELHIDNPGTGNYTTTNVDKIFINGQEQGKSETVADLQNGQTLTGTDLFDTLTVTTWSGGTIESLASDDSIYVENTVNTLETLTATNSAGADTIYLENGFALGTLDLTGNGTFFVTGNTLVNGFSMSGGTINGGNGADTFNINDMTGGTINGGDGNDLFSVQSLTSGAINGGSGSDTLSTASTIVTHINLANVSNIEHFTIGTVHNSGSLSLSNNADSMHINDIAGTGAIYALAGNDIISVTTANGGTIDGGAGSDDITVTTMNGVTIDGGADSDEITVTTASGGIIDGGAGNDSITISNVTGAVDLENSGGNDNYYLTSGLADNTSVIMADSNGSYTVQGSTSGTGFSMGSNASITGSDGNDIFYVSAMGMDDSATINGGDGDDSYYVMETVINPMGTLNNAAGADTVFINSSISGGELSLGGNAGFTITGSNASTGFTMMGGTITGTDHADTFNLGLTSSTNTINTGAGTDSVHITRTNSSSSLTINNTGADSDHIYFDTALSNAGEYTLTSTTAGFTVTNSAGTGFELGNGSTVNGSDMADSFTLQSMNGGTLNGGAGNDTFTATTMSGGTLNGDGGDDSITISTWTGGSIHAGAGTAAGNTITIENSINTANALSVSSAGSGVDTITFENGISSGTVNFAHTGSGNFYITGGSSDEGVSMTGGTLNGSTRSDDIKIQTLSGSSSVQGQAGNDTFTVTTMSGGTLDGGDGNDTIFITTWNGGSIHAGDGSAAGNTITIENSINTANTLSASSAGSGVDTITFEGVIASGTINLSHNGSGSFHVTGSDSGVGLTMTGGTLNATDKADSLEINALSGTSVINGSDGDDTITITTMDGGSINTGSGYSEITIDTWNGGEITTNSSTWTDIIINNTVNTANTLSITNNGSLNNNDIFFETGMSSGTINLNSVNYGFDVDGNGGGNGSGVVMSGGTINMSAKADSIEIFTISDGAINGGDDNDSFEISNTMSGGTIDGGDGSDTINVRNTLSSGTINGGNDNDFIEIHNTMSGGTINGGDGSDTISIDTFTGGTISQSYGNDTVNIAYINGTLTLNAGLQFNLGTVNTGGNVTSSLSDYTIRVENMQGGSLTNANGVSSPSFIIENTINTTEAINIINSSVSYHQANLYLHGGLHQGTVNLSQTGNGQGFNVFGTEDYVGFTMTGGTIVGTDESEYIEIKELSGGTINTGAGTHNYVDVENTINTTNTLTFINEQSASGSASYYDRLHIRLVGGMADGTINLTATGNAGFDVSGGSSVGFDFSGGTVIGSAQADAFDIGTMSSTATVNGNGGNDTITIADYASGTILGGAGDDSLIIENVSGSLDISTLTGIETITIKGVSGSYTGTANAENFTFETVNNGTIDGNDGGDRYTIERLSGTLNTFTDAGTVDILFMDPGANYTAQGNTTILLNGQTMGNIIEENFLDRDITGTSAADIFTIDTWSSGTITTLESADDVIIGSTLSNGNFTVENSAGADRIFLQGGMYGGILNLNGAGSFLVNGADADTDFTLSGGTINGSAGNDTFNIATMNGGTVNGNGGNDSITLQSMEGGTINAGEGDNNILITNWTDGTITAGTGYNTASITNIYGSLDLSSMATIDAITLGTVHTSGEVTGSGTVIINSVRGGKLNGEGTADNFLIQNTMEGGIIDSGDGTDTVFVNTLSGSNNIFTNVEALRFTTIESGATFSIDDKLTSLRLGNDVVGIHDDGTTMSGTADKDLGYIKDMSAGTLDLANGDDVLFVATLSGDSTIEAGYGNDTISVVEMGDAGASIYGGEDNDSIYVGKLGSGTIDAGYGDDIVVISSLEGGTVKNSGYSDTDVLTVDSMKGGTVSGYHTVNINTLEGGSITTKTFGTVTVDTMKGGSIGNPYNPSNIVVNALESGNINGGDGKDTFTVNITNTDSQADDRPQIRLGGNDGVEDTLTITIDGSTGSTYHVNVSDYEASDKIKLGDNLMVEIGDLSLTNNTYTHTQDSSTLILYFSQLQAIEH